MSELIFYLLAIACIYAEVWSANNHRAERKENRKEKKNND